MSDELALAIGQNFGRGMKCGETCGAITGGLMVLGALGRRLKRIDNITGF